VETTVLGKTLGTTVWYEPRKKPSSWIENDENIAYRLWISKAKIGIDSYFVILDNCEEVFSDITFTSMHKIPEVLDYIGQEHVDNSEDANWIELNKQLSNLLASHANQHVALVDGSIVDFDYDEDALISRVGSKFPDGEILIHHLVPELPVFEIRGPRSSTEDVK